MKGQVQNITLTLYSQEVFVTRFLHGEMQVIGSRDQVVQLE